MQTTGSSLLLQPTYVYDALANRIEKDVYTSGSGTTVNCFGYDGQDVWVDLNASNALQTRYLRGENPTVIVNPANPPPVV